MAAKAAKRYDLVSIPVADKGLERVDRLARLLEKETGISPVQRYAAVLKAVDEAIERRTAKRKADAGQS